MAGTAHITTQSACGDFGAAFLKRLPALEKAMIDHGIDPSNVIISKNPAQVTRLTIAYRPTGHPSDYTVFVDGRSFTVTHQDDMSFFKYLYGLCVNGNTADDSKKSSAAAARLTAFVGRMIRWLNQPI